jgi:hypothetical protein
MEERKYKYDKDGEPMVYVPWTRPTVRISVTGVVELAATLGIDVGREDAQAISVGIRPPGFNRSYFERISAAIAKNAEKEPVTDA